MRLGGFQPQPHHVDVLPRRFAATSRLLLEAVQDVDRSKKPDSVDGAVRIAVKIIDNLQHAAATETFQRLRIRMFFAVLCDVDGNAHDAASVIWKSPQIVS